VKLKRLEIHNYKSLRNVLIEPGPLSVFVGPNAAGKSNLADAQIWTASAATSLLWSTS
jgi:AAA15 family ATPase/GTPase